MDDLLEDQIRSVDGVLKSWKWEPGKVLQNFAEYTGVPDSGAITDALRTILLVRDVSGELSQWIRSNGVLKSLTKWRVSTAGGFTIAEKSILQKVRTEAGELLMWTYHPDGALKGFSKWSKSAGDLSAKAADQVTHAVRSITGQLELTEWVEGTFHQASKWAISSASGIAKAADCILYQVRNVNGIFDEWQLDKGGVKVYAKWEKSAKSGASLAVDNVLWIERQGEKIVKNVFKEGVSVTSQVVDAAGNVILDLGKAAGKAWDSITHWHF